MSVGPMIVTTELRAGAKLYRYEQITGGFKWALVGARITPVSLDKICETMLTCGFLTEGEERGEYKLWRT